MIDNYELVLKIVNAAIKGEHLDLSNQHENKELLITMKEQTFLAYLYYVSKDSFFNPYYISSCLIHEQFKNFATLIKSLFDKNDIDHIFLKGSTMQYLYPDKNLRMLGDIDVLVREKDINRACELLKENGFIFQDRADHHVGFQYKKLEFELHNRIIEYTHPLHDYLKGPFSHAYKKDNNTYALEDNFNFIYILSHYMKHLKNGSGIRSLIDVYLLLTKTNIDLDYCYEIFKKYGYEDFFKVSMTALKRIFDYENKYQVSKYADDLITYSLNSGIHGFGKNNDYIKNKQVSTSNNKFIYLLKVLFVPIPTLFSYYPWTKSIILIPFGYIARFFHLLFKRHDKFKHVLHSAKQDDQFFKNIGIKND